jgi:hypothetical protein
MGEDGCSMNDLPKVTSILSSERITKPAAFDIMIRFLSTHNTKYSNSQQNQFGQIYHFSEDLFHLTETLATTNGTDNFDDTDPQQIKLRKLRLAAKPVKTELIDDSIAEKNPESFSNDDMKNLRVDDDMDLDKTIEKKAVKKSNKKEKKKEKKRKRESVES